MSRVPPGQGENGTDSGEWWEFPALGRSEACSCGAAAPILLPDLNLLTVTSAEECSPPPPRAWLCTTLNLQNLKEKKTQNISVHHLLPVRICGFSDLLVPRCCGGCPIPAPILSISVLRWAESWRSRGVYCRWPLVRQALTHSASSGSHGGSKRNPSHLQLTEEESEVHSGWQ